MTNKLNLYYIISIITLAFMMFILFRTLQVRGWFEKHGSLSPAEYVLKTYEGSYTLTGTQDLELDWQSLIIEASSTHENENWVVVSLDSMPRYEIKLSDFEDEQVLVEIYQLDSTGYTHRVEGCEILLSEAESGEFTGGTIGDFCGLKQGSSEYLVLDLLLDDPTVSLQTEVRLSGKQGNLEMKNYLLKRID